MGRQPFRRRSEWSWSQPLLRGRPEYWPQRSRTPGYEQVRPPLPVIDQLGPPPSDIRLPRHGPRRSQTLAAPPEFVHQGPVPTGRFVAKETDYRRRPLRARRDRPCDDRAANKRDELASLVCALHEDHALRNDLSLALCAPN